MKVSTTTGESIRALVSRLLAKRGLRLTSFDVFSSKVIMVIIRVMLMLMLMVMVMVMVMDSKTMFRMRGNLLISPKTVPFYIAQR